MESQPQNPEFRINPENSHPWKVKIRNRYNQVPHLTQDNVWESDITQENITCMRAKRSALSQQVTTRLQERDMAPNAWLPKLHKRLL